MYECFAASLNLPIGGLGAEEQMDIATAAKSGPIFDFAMLRLLRDKYSIDPARNRAAESEGGHHRHGGRKKKGGKGGSRKRTGSIDEEASGSVAASDADDDDDGTGSSGAASAVASSEGGGGSASSSPLPRASSHGVSNILERAVDRNHFRRLLRDVWRCPEDALFLSDRVFDYMDEDGSGSIDVRRRVCILVPPCPC